MGNAERVALSGSEKALIPVVWSEPALANLRAIRAYYEPLNPRAAGELARRLIEAGESLAQAPFRGRPVQGTSARELLSVPPYLIRYRIRSDAIRILRVRHMVRRPTRP